MSLQAEQSRCPRSGSTEPTTTPVALSARLTWRQFHSIDTARLTEGRVAVSQGALGGAHLHGVDFRLREKHIGGGEVAVDDGVWPHHVEAVQAPGAV